MTLLQAQVLLTIMVLWASSVVASSITKPDDEQSESESKSQKTPKVFSWILGIAVVAWIAVLFATLLD